MPRRALPPFRAVLLYRFGEDTMTDKTNVFSGAWSAIRREPLVLFAILGGMASVAWVALAPRAANTIRIETETLRALETYQVELEGRPLTDAEWTAVREGYIDEEVLLHEAITRGLHWSDSRVRQRLVRIMRAAMTETVPEPSVAQLRAYFDENIDRYTRPESVSVHQVMFPWVEEKTPEELQEILEQLRSGADPEQFGTATMSVRRAMPRQTRTDLVRAFGADFADRIKVLPQGEWQGPIESIQGIHLVRVLERHPPEVADFEKMESYLGQDWVMTRTRELQQQRVDEIRKRYRIELVGEPSGRSETD